VLVDGTLAAGLDARAVRVRAVASRRLRARASRVRLADRARAVARAFALAVALAWAAAREASADLTSVAIAIMALVACSAIALKGLMTLVVDSWAWVVGRGALWCLGFDELVAATTPTAMTTRPKTATTVRPTHLGRDELVVERPRDLGPRGEEILWASAASSADPRGVVVASWRG
jgi:hypothetical protein